MRRWWPRLKKTPSLWRRSSNGRGGLDGPRGTPPRGVAVIPPPEDHLHPPVSEAPCGGRVSRRGSGPHLRVGADGAPHRRLPNAPDLARSIGRSSGDGSRGRGVCEPTERHVRGGTRRGTVLPSEVPLDGSSQRASDVAADDPAVSPPPAGVPRVVPVTGERGGGVLRDQAPPRAVPSSDGPCDATEGGGMAHDREESGPAGALPRPKGKSMNYGTQPPEPQRTYPPPPPSSLERPKSPPLPCSPGPQRRLPDRHLATSMTAALKPDLRPIAVVVPLPPSYRGGRR